MPFFKISVVIAALAAGSCFTSVAQASGRVSWSVNVDVPAARVYSPSPFYYEQAPVPVYYYRPAPPVYYQPPPVVLPPPQVVVPGWGYGHHHHHHDSGYREYRDEYGERHHGRARW